MTYYHVRIDVKSSPPTAIVKLDLSEEQLRERFLSPYEAGTSITTMGKTIKVQDIDQIRITRTDQRSDELRNTISQDRQRRRLSSWRPIEWFIAASGEDITDDLITTAPGTKRTPYGIAEAPAQLIGEIWLPNTIRTFISHVSADRVEVGKLAEQLNTFGLSCFVAHTAIEPSREWQRVIEAALDTCDAILTYLTRDFHKSVWTDQEVGWALARRVLVLPLDVGAKPYGFLGSYQALSIADDSSAWTASHPVARGLALAIFGGQTTGAERLQPIMTTGLVERFCKSGSFEDARRCFGLLSVIPRRCWTPPHFEAMRRAASENRQVRECGLRTGKFAPEAIEDLVKTLTT